MINEIKFRSKQVITKKNSDKKRQQICKKNKTTKNLKKFVPEFFSLTYVTTVTGCVIFFVERLCG